MSALADADAKKILRAALIGVSPADQVMLKGYLRILLRLQFDFEWVSASYSNIDLLMINKDFRHSSSVVKLLREQQHKSVLYISRTDADDGEMVDNNIILPLKNLDDLDRWLRKSILTPIANIEERNQYSKSEPITQLSTFSSEIKSELFTSDSQIDLYDAAAPQNSHSDNSTGHINKTFNDHQAAGNHQSVIHLIQTLQQRPVGFYQIATTDQVLAIVEPKRARLWLVGAEVDSMLPPLTTDWQLREYNDQLPSDDQACDMIQWLWQCAWQKIEILLPLINDDGLYQLRYWIKPAFKVDHTVMNNQRAAARAQAKLLKVMTELESQPRNVNELSNLAGVSVNTAKKIIAGLMFSGSLQAKSYHHIDTIVTIQYGHLAADYSDAIQVKSETDVITDTSAAFADTDTRSTFDKLIDQRARQQDINNTVVDTISVEHHTQSSTVNTKSIDMVAQENANKQQKLGFLSRLRQKLGL